MMTAKVTENVFAKANENCVYYEKLYRKSLN